ncbi:TPA: acyltransferase family protein [Haemophilus influenzae]|uniref:acyltransferase family protein n=2 Tax=Haemophilus influenzae TaxID=727 RepID=UPI0006832C15|nr:acyltransferase family protein [Haemophilus influenzae]AVJ02778.1 acyltransferase family protein [Haemophilus influenzae]KMZ37029.1 acyltransferase [Haemophilus influenzae]MCK8798928.1 acyltransferase [Haemophilus influenzae]MCK8889340.1 acyltransferase [Haemophilus influenzae]PRJ17496.1 O-acetyltransferase OatA [Haemophilus influenzae]
MSSIKYRPEIDGLRAIAVISVIIYHLNENWLSGGFLGVDIFFVISGFLITGIIITEIQQNSFSLKQFYTRRIKRIYPAFITVMALVSFIASVIFIYNDFNKLRKTIELAIAFLSNFYLGLTQGYFDLSANENPVLHIWSLAVEEQYYLIFPLILILAYKKFREIKVLFIITLILFFILLATSFVSANFYKEVLHQPNIYYLSNLRFPELLVGSLLAIYHNLSNKVQLSKQVNNILAILSTLLLFSCLFLMNNDIAYIPGITLILPCIFTALIIHTTSQNNIVKLCLSNKAIVFIGKISYSLYLYHWIFIAFAYYITGEKQINNQSIAIVIVLTIIFSVLSYYLIEQPIRKSKLNFKQSFLYIYFIPSLLLLGFNLYKRQTIRAEKEHIEQSIPVSNENHYPAKVIILGDSHSSHLEAFLNYVGNKEGWKADIFKDKFECSFIVNEQYQLDPNCQSVWQKDSQYKAIFISAFYDLRMGGQPVPRFRPETFIEPDFKARFKETVKQLAMQKPVYVFANNSSVSRSPLRGYLLENYGLEKYLTPIHRMGDIDASNKIIHDLVKDIPNVYWVDAQQYLPKDSVMAEGKYLYGDQDHLTNFGAYYMAKEFSKYQRVMTPEQVKKLYE